MKLRSSFVANSSSSSFILELKKDRKPFMCLGTRCENCKKEICETNIHAIDLTTYTNTIDDTMYQNCVNNVIPRSKEKIIEYVKGFIKHSDKMHYKDMKEDIIKRAYYNMLMNIAYSYINALFEGKSLYKELVEDCRYVYELYDDIHCLIECIENLFYSYKNKCALIVIEINDHYEPGWRVINDLDDNYENKNFKVRKSEHD